MTVVVAVLVGLVAGTAAGFYLGVRFAAGHLPDVLARFGPAELSELAARVVQRRSEVD